MYTVILAIVIHNNITPAQVIDAKPFCHRSSDAVAHIVVSTVVSEIPKRERLEFLKFRIIREQRVLEAFIAVFLAQGNRERFLFFGATVLPRNFVIAHHAERRSLRLIRLKEFHINRKFAITPEVRALFGVHHGGPITRHVKARIGTEHRQRIRRYK